MNKRTVQLVKEFINENGVTNTILNSVSFYKTTYHQPKSPHIFSLRLIFVIQGKKEAYVGDELFIYDKQNYLVVPTSLPLDCQGFATKENPFISLRIDIDKDIMYEIIDSISKKHLKKETSLGVFTDKINEDIEESLSKLIQLLTAKEPSKYLANLAIKEIFYKVASNKNAHILHKIYSNNIESNITKAIKYIKDNYNENIDISELARTAQMSNSSFYTHFKAISSLAPLQYIKSIRLNKSKQLMQEFGFNLKELSLFVGYKSLSQFSRDYKRYFGYAPSEEKAKYKSSLGL